MHYSKVVDGSKRFPLAVLLALGASTVAVGNAVTKVKPADSKPFIGAWSIALPEGAGVIVNKPDVGWDNPAVIKAGSNDMISIRTPKGDAGNWAVKSIGGRNALWREMVSTRLWAQIGLTPTVSCSVAKMHQASRPTGPAPSSGRAASDPNSRERGVL